MYVYVFIIKNMLSLKLIKKGFIMKVKLESIVLMLEFEFKYLEIYVYLLY